MLAGTLMILIHQIDHSVAIFFFHPLFIYHSLRKTLTFASPSTHPNQFLPNFHVIVRPLYWHHVARIPCQSWRALRARPSMGDCRYKRVTVKESHMKRHDLNWCNTLLSGTVTTGFFSCWSWIGVGHFWGHTYWKARYFIHIRSIHIDWRCYAATV